MKKPWHVFVKAEVHQFFGTQCICTVILQQTCSVDNLMLLK